MVLPTPLPSKGNANVALTQLGTPLFVAEVASPSTVVNDRRGKRETYAGAGIAEYLIFDPSDERLGRRGVMVEAWRLPHAGARRYDRWEPDEDGAWRSRALGVRLHMAGLFLHVEDYKGEMIPTILVGMRERETALRERDKERAARQRAEQEHQRADERIRALEEELRRLRGR